MMILEDLYVGDIHPSERSFKKDIQNAKALNEGNMWYDKKPVHFCLKAGEMDWFFVIFR